jgi:hypothetical protein
VLKATRRLEEVLVAVVVVEAEGALAQLTAVVTAVVRRDAGCSHCRSPKLHELAKVRPSKQVCPVKDFAAKKAKAIAKSAVEKWETEPADGGFQVTLDEAIAGYSDEG